MYVLSYQMVLRGELRGIYSLPTPHNYSTGPLLSQGARPPYSAETPLGIGAVRNFEDIYFETFILVVHSWSASLSAFPATDHVPNF